MAGLDRAGQGWIELCSTQALLLKFYWDAPHVNFFCKVFLTSSTKNLRFLYPLQSERKDQVFLGFSTKKIYGDHPKKGTAVHRGMYNTKK